MEGLSTLFAADCFKDYPEGFLPPALQPRPSKNIAHILVHFGFL